MSVVPAPNAVKSEARMLIDGELVEAGFEQYLETKAVAWPAA